MMLKCGSVKSFFNAAFLMPLSTPGATNRA